jgi:hypothetical protein
MLSAMLADKNYDEAGKHLETLLGEVKGMSPKYVTGDEMLDCIVGMKASKMEEDDIKVSDATCKFTITYDSYEEVGDLTPSDY